jgi:hypothetical protein
MKYENIPEKVINKNTGHEKYIKRQIATWE